MHCMKNGRLHYLSKAAFPDGSQYLEVVKVHCEEKERKREEASVSVRSATFQDREHNVSCNHLV